MASINLQGSKTTSALADKHGFFGSANKKSPEKPKSVTLIFSRQHLPSSDLADQLGTIFAGDGVQVQKLSPETANKTTVNASVQNTVVILGSKTLTANNQLKTAIKASSHTVLALLEGEFDPVFGELLPKQENHSKYIRNTCTPMSNNPQDLAYTIKAKTYKIDQRRSSYINDVRTMIEAKANEIYPSMDTPAPSASSTPRPGPRFSGS